MFIVSTSRASGILAPHFLTLSGEAAIPLAENSNGSKSLPIDMPFPAKEMVAVTAFVSTGGKTEFWKQNGDKKEQTLLVTYRPDGAVHEVYEKTADIIRKYRSLDPMEAATKYGFYQGMNPDILKKLADRVLPPREDFPVDRFIAAYPNTLYSNPEVETANEGNKTKIILDMTRPEIVDSAIETIKIMTRFLTEKEAVLKEFRGDMEKVIQRDGVSPGLAELIRGQVDAVSAQFLNGTLDVKGEEFSKWIPFEAATFDSLEKGKFPTPQNHYERHTNNIIAQMAEMPIGKMIEDARVSTSFGGYFFAQSVVHGSMVIENHVLNMSNQYDTLKDKEFVINNALKKISSAVLNARAEQNITGQIASYSALNQKAQDIIAAEVGIINDRIQKLGLGEKITPDALVKFPQGQTLSVKLVVDERRNILGMGALYDNAIRKDGRIKLPANSGGFSYTLSRTLEGGKLPYTSMMISRRDGAYGKVLDPKDTKAPKVILKTVKFSPMMIVGRNNIEAIISQPSLYEKISSSIVTLSKVLEDSAVYSYEKKDPKTGEVIETVQQTVDIDKTIDRVLKELQKEAPLVLGKQNLDAMIQDLGVAKQLEGKEKAKAVHRIITKKVDEAGQPLTYAPIIDTAMAPGSRDFNLTLKKAYFVKNYPEVAADIREEIQQGFEKGNLNQVAAYPKIDFPDSLTKEKKTELLRGATSFYYDVIRMASVRSEILTKAANEGELTERYAKELAAAKEKAHHAGVEFKPFSAVKKASYTPGMNETKDAKSVLHSLTNLEKPYFWPTAKVKGVENQYVEKIKRVLFGREATVLAPKHLDKIREAMATGVEKYKAILEAIDPFIDSVRVAQNKNSTGKKDKAATAAIGISAALMRDDFENLGVAETATTVTPAQADTQIPATEATTQVAETAVKTPAVEAVTVEAVAETPVVEAVVVEAVVVEAVIVEADDGIDMSEIAAAVLAQDSDESEGYVIGDDEFGDIMDIFGTDDDDEDIDFGLLSQEASDLLGEDVNNLISGMGIPVEDETESVSAKL